jgi:hypothetical protein
MPLQRPIYPDCVSRPGLPVVDYGEGYWRQLEGPADVDRREGVGWAVIGRGQNPGACDRDGPTSAVGKLTQAAGRVCGEKRSRLQLAGGEN